jgi:hypothetical protein
VESIGDTLGDDDSRRGDDDDSRRDDDDDSRRDDDDQFSFMVFFCGGK